MNFTKSDVSVYKFLCLLSERISLVRKLTLYLRGKNCHSFYYKTEVLYKILSEDYRTISTLTEVKESNIEERHGKGEVREIDCGSGPLKVQSLIK